MKPLERHLDVQSFKKMRVLVQKAPAAVYHCFSRSKEFLFDMHRWAYVGMIQMGLLCAVLMKNEGNHGKRQVMQQRAPVLLHPKFLTKAKEVLHQATLDKGLRKRLIEDA